MNATGFHPTSRFPFAAVLEAHAERIRVEFAGVRDRMVDWVERDLYGEGWKVFGLFDFPHGAPLDEGVRACPETAALIARHIPTHGAAGFSLLRPGTRIRPHEGFKGRYLRCHLGIEIPAGDCGLRIAGETYRWQAGKVVIFDDRPLHDAWNLTPHDRVVLLIDFVP
jgi:beta-hydroxylase